MKKSILKTVHEAACDLFKIGLLDIKTMHTFDAMCLPKIKKLTPKQIKNLYFREKVSKCPTGPTLKLLNLVEKKGLAILMA